MGITEESAGLVAKNIKVFMKGFVREVNRDMEKIRQVLDDRVTLNMSLTDHTLKGLADMGHPYAARAPQKIHDPEYQVHTQSGALLGGKYSGVNKARVTNRKLRFSAFVGIEGIAHAVHVIFGTSKMIPRDFLDGSLQEESDRILTLLSRSMRNTVVSFNGRQVKL